MALSENENLPLESLPKTALQAIYHAVTGKTESLAKELKGNVIVTSADIDRLYGMLLDQLGIHEKVIDPTVTVVVKQANEKSVTYSSWERYKKLLLNNHEITSEISLKLEFVIQLPETPQHQRCIVNVNLDSALPVISEKKAFSDMEPLGMFIFFRREWPTVDLSIDFVDFLVAKSFVNVVEEWFGTLQHTPQKKFNNFLLRHYQVLRESLGQFGRIGLAAFLGGYVWFNDGEINSLGDLTLAVALGLLIWAVFLVLKSPIERKLLKRLTLNIIPSVIILTEGDERTYSEIESSLNSPLNTLLTYLVTAILSLFVNVGSSYLYTYLSGS